MTTIPIIRTSERKDWHRCQKRWVWAWRNGLRSLGFSADALWFGIGIHIALAEWYCGPGLKRGPHPAETFRKYVKDEIRFMRTESYRGQPWDEQEYVEAGKLGVAMLTAYIEYYGEDDSWHIIKPEQTFQIDVPGHDGKVIAVFAGTIDLPYRDLEDDLIWLGEHKSYKTIDLKHLPLDPQVTGYCAVADIILRHQGLLKKGDRFEGMTYNVLRKAMPDERPKNAEGYSLNKDGTVSKRQPVEYFHREPLIRTRFELAKEIKNLRDEVQQMNFIRERKMQPTKNRTRDCGWDCDFFEMCQVHEAGGDWKAFRDSMYEKLDPYADHRKSAAE